MDAIKTTLKWARTSGMNFWHRDFPVRCGVKYNQDTDEYVIAEMDYRHTPIATVVGEEAAIAVLKGQLYSNEEQCNIQLFADNWLRN